MAKLTLGELADHLAAELIGPREQVVAGLRALAEAGAADLSFVHEAKYKNEAEKSGAGAFLVPQNLREVAASFGRPLLVVAQSQLALIQALELFHPRQRPPAGVHPSAVIGAGVQLGDGVAIGPYAVIGDGSRLGDGVVVEAHVVVGRNCTLGRDVLLHPGVILYDGCELGERVEVHSGSVIGADGFGYASVRGVYHKVPQVGKVVLENDVEVGACTTIDRAALEVTRIGTGTKIDNLVQVGHNVTTGKGCLLCGQVGIAGSTKLGDYVIMAGSAGASGHIEIGNGVVLAACSVALQSVEAGRQVAGVPAVDLPDWRRQISALPRLPELLRRVRRLEKELQELRGGDPDPG